MKEDSKDNNFRKFKINKNYIKGTIIITTPYAELSFKENFLSSQ
jgi:hypothetical protein